VLGGHRRGGGIRTKRLRAGIAVSASCALACVVVAAVSAGTGAQVELVKGTKKAETLTGTVGKDRILGYSGDDWLRGLAGDDILDGGRGRDIVSGGPGKDRILARDGLRDRIYCGLGADTVVADVLDRVQGDCETVLRPSTEPKPPPPSGESVVRVDQTWTCNSAVNLDLVKITMNAGAKDSDAVQLRSNCSGRIGRIEIETWRTDGVKINAPAPVAHDLTIWGGYIRCYDHSPGAHQDGVQALGGERITFRNVEINCNSDPNSQFFLNAANGGIPTDVLCERCFLGTGAATTLRVAESIRSGARNTNVCPGRFQSINLMRSVDAVNIGNTILLETDPRC
jgi:Ca2+-binding RTX toxin-like protein